MGLITDFITEKQKDYLNIHKAILIMKHFCKESGRAIGIFLAQTQIFKNLPLYKKDDFLSFNIVEDDNLANKVIEYLTSGKTDNSGFLPDGVQKSFWKISDFLNFPPIKRLSINQDVIEHFLNYRYYSDKSDSYEPFKDFLYNNKSMSQQSKAPPPINPLKGGSYPSKKVEKDNNLNEQLQQENKKLKIELAQSQARIEELEKLNVNIGLSDISEEHLTGLARRNQLAQDRQGMARIIALNLWKDDTSILIGDMANKVYATMVDYCREDLPQNPETIKNWIRPVATEEAQRKGRPKSNG